MEGDWFEKHTINVIRVIILHTPERGGGKVEILNN